MIFLLCVNCSHGQGDSLAASHKCLTCDLETYTEYKLCLSCAMENNQCQTCTGAVSPIIDAASRALVTQARANFQECVTSANAQYDAQLAGIKVDIDSGLPVGSEKLARFASAVQARDLKIRRAARRFELFAERICAHRAVDLDYARKLATLEV